MVTFMELLYSFPVSKDTTTDSVCWQPSTRKDFEELWDMVFSLFGVSWVMPRSVVELLGSWQGRVGRSESGVI
uniref:Uncharacterized protein n=1 Tax=Fagus sylvatica TaxID=28930 RepID=A0A2N9IIR1_FAGSY